MNKRKLFGTVIGFIFWSFCVIFFTYAYYDWRSDPINVVLGIEDLSLECLVGADVEVSNIGPVLNYQDGVKVEFAINNAMTDNMTIELYLDIITISDNLLTDSLKYVLVADSTGGTNYDYNTPLLEGDFSNFNIGNNLVTQDLEVISEITTNYQFIIYIDGNMYNDPNMQENSLVGNLLIGKCSGDSVPYDELVYQAIYSETDNSLTFVHTTPLTVGDTYNDKAVTTVYTGFDTATYTSQNNVPWYKDGNYQNITTVNFDSVIKPKSTAYWFYNFDGIENLDLSKLNTIDTINMKFMVYSCNNLINVEFSEFSTSKVTTMDDMFNGCNSLVGLDLSNFNTSSVTSMGRMFKGCNSLIKLDLSNFNTSKVQWVDDMFNGCSSLIELDLSNFDTSKVTDMRGMFNGCSSLIRLDLSSFDTSNVLYMGDYYGGKGGMFQGCSSLIELDLNNFNTSKVVDMECIFYGCSSLKKLVLNNFNTSSATDMQWMFRNCSSLVSLDVSSFNTSNVTNLNHMFDNCSSLTELDLSNFNTSNVTNMESLFIGCSSLISLDLSNFDTSKLNSLSGMFWTCSSLISLDVSNWDVSNVTSLYMTFRGCGNLINLDLSKWDMTKVTNMQYTFYQCRKLETTMTITNAEASFTNIFTYAGVEIIVNYASSVESFVDDWVANIYTGNVVKGICVDCVVDETTGEEIIE